MVAIQSLAAASVVIGSLVAALVPHQEAANQLFARQEPSVITLERVTVTVTSTVTDCGTTPAVPPSTASTTTEVILSTSFPDTTVTESSTATVETTAETTSTVTETPIISTSSSSVTTDDLPPPVSYPTDSVPPTDNTATFVPATETGTGITSQTPPTTTTRVSSTSSVTSSTHTTSSGAAFTPPAPNNGVGILNANSGLMVAFAALAAFY